MIISEKEARRRKCPITRKNCLVADCIKWRGGFVVVSAAGSESAGNCVLSESEVTL